jgi:hypothetical protein
VAFCGISSQVLRAKVARRLRGERAGLVDSIHRQLRHPAPLVPKIPGRGREVGVACELRRRRRGARFLVLIRTFVAHVAHLHFLARELMRRSRGLLGQAEVLLDTAALIPLHQPVPSLHRHLAAAVASSTFVPRQRS